MGARTPDRVFVVGASGTGKTTRARALLETIVRDRRAAGMRSRIVVFDPQAEWWLRGATRVRSRRELLLALRAERFPLVVEEVIVEWSPLERMRDMVVVIDEAHNFATPSRIEPCFRKLCCESRHFNTDVVIVTQRPRHLNHVVIANATRALILPLQSDSDRSAVEGGLGITLPSPAAWRRVPGAENPRAREPLVWPDDFEPGTMGGNGNGEPTHEEEDDEEEDDGAEAVG